MLHDASSATDAAEAAFLAALAPDDAERLRRLLQAVVRERGSDADPDR